MQCCLKCNVVCNAMLSAMRMGNPQDFFILTVVTVIFAEVSKNLYCFKRCK